MIIIGDIHAKRNYVFDAKHEVNDRYLRLIDILFKRIAHYCKISKSNTVVFLGDIFDTSEVLDTITLNIVLNNFEFLINKNLDIIILCGNHDKIKFKGYKFSPVTVLEKIGIKVIKKPKTIKNHLFIPYGYNVSNLKHHKIIFTHLANKLSSPFDQDAINPGIINGDIIINGHIHKSETFQLKENKTFINIGVPFPTRKGEEHWENRLLYLNKDKLQTIKLKIYKVQYIKILNNTQLKDIKPDITYDINTLYLTIPIDFKTSNQDIKKLLKGFDTIQIYRGKDIKFDPNIELKQTKIKTNFGLFKEIISKVEVEGLNKKKLFMLGAQIIKDTESEYGEDMDYMQTM